MPSVTRWRQPQNIVGQRPQSPTRPTSFEALDDLPPPSRYDAHPDFPRGAYNVQGLGVSIDGEREFEDHMAEPSMLSYAMNGAPYPARTPLPAAGSYTHSSEHAYHWTHSQSPYNSSIKRKRVQGHIRSHSAMDDLANAAIADDSPQGPYHSRPATSYIDGHSFEEYGRASKRVKSERLPQTVWESQDPRPHTSHLDPAQQAEAELLLHFSTHVHKSPPAQHNQYQSSESQRGFSHASGKSLTNGVTDSEVDIGHSVQSWQQHAHNINGLRTDILGNASSEEMTNPLSDQIGHRIEELRPSLLAHEDHLVPSGSETGRVTPGVKEPKKPRRVKPEVQQSSCAVCERMQSVNVNNDETFANNWISCNGCEKWYHSACVGFKDKREVQGVDKFICGDCKPVHGETTFVRKSSRARTAIDYAGLNQGLVKSSKDTSLHHYIQPIKDGTLKFEPDRFARMRPELVTAEYFEKSGGMKDPFVVPAAWNPRFGESSPYINEDGAEDVDGVAVSGMNEANDAGVTLGNDATVSIERVIDCDQDLLDMVMPRQLTVRKAVDLYGPSETVPVIDVKTQESHKSTLKKWADYYDAPGEKAIRNVISLEVSHSSLGRLVRRPKIVRDLDLQDAVWPADMGNRKFVAFYCLMSVADSYTDFHIDFGGSSVYYHILKGRKTFFFIPPEDKNLKKYQDWCNSDTQNETFLGDLTGDCIRVDLYPGDTAFIPAGWIHAVWTPEDSLVIGGNFLTRLHYELQLKIANIERDTKVPPSFKYPLFQKVMWLALLKYLEDDPLPEEVKNDFIDDSEHVFRRANPVWHEFGPLANDKEPGDEYYNARFYPKAEIGGLVPLRDYLYRTALIASNMEVEGVTKDARNRVIGSIPKVAQADSLSYARTFGIWCAWKIGNVQSPEWTRSSDGEKPLSIESEPVKAWPDRVPAERFSKRVASLSSQAELARMQAGAMATPAEESPQTLQNVDYTTSSALRPTSAAKPSGLGPKRVACEPCRKRRIKCRHKEEADSPVTPASGSNLPRPRALSTVSNDVYTLSFFNGFEPGSVSLQKTRSTSLNLSADLQQTSNLVPERLSSPVDGSAMSSGKKGRSKACEECRKSKVGSLLLQDLITTNGNSVAACTMRTARLTQPKAPNQLGREAQQLQSGRPAPAMSSRLMPSDPKLAMISTESSTLTSPRVSYLSNHSQTYMKLPSSCSPLQMLFAIPARR